MFCILYQFGASGCIDKKVIQGLIEYGSSLNTCEDAFPLFVVLFHTVSKPGARAPVPNDSFYGLAIASGFLEMCSGMVMKFGRHLGKNALCLMSATIDGASAVKLQKRSSKAIADHRSTVLAMIHPVNMIHVDKKCQDILQTILAMVESSGGTEKYKEQAHCRLCYKLLEAGAILRCSKCKRAVYCSRECQLVDWKNGHKKDCKDIATYGVQVMNAGFGRDVKKAKQHEQNVIIAGSKAFSQNIQTIMLRAILQGYSILDCVVIIRLMKSPPLIEVKFAQDFLSACRKNSAEEFDQLKRIVSRNQANGAVSCSYQSLGVHDETNPQDILSTASLLKTFPAESAPYGSWTAFQQRMEHYMPARFEVYKHDAALREELFRNF